MGRPKSKKGDICFKKPLFAIKRKTAKTYKEQWMTLVLREMKVRNYPGNLVVVLKNGFQRTDFWDMMEKRYPELKVEGFYLDSFMFLTVPIREESTYIKSLLREDCVFDVEVSALQVN